MIRRSWGKTMNTGIRRIGALAIGMVLIAFANGVMAAPAGLPQQMLPGYAPASPARGVASFSPPYRVQPPPRAARFGPPPYRAPYYGPMRRASNWPIPVSYRPIAPMPYARLPFNAYPGQMPRWAGYPAPVQGYGVRPLPHMAQGYPRHYPMRAWSYPQSPRMGTPTPYSRVAPVSYTRPWVAPRRAITPMPYRVYPYRQSGGRPVAPTPQSLPRQFAGRYQPYSRMPGGQPDYRFRPMPQPMMDQLQRAVPIRPMAAGYPGDYRFRQDRRLQGMAGRSVPPYQGWQMPAETMRRHEALAWDGTAQRLRRAAY